MGYIRKKNISGNDYLYEQESYRDQGNVRTKHIRYIGGRNKSLQKSTYKPYPQSYHKLSKEQQEDIQISTEAKRQLYEDKERKMSIKATERLFKRGYVSKEIYYNKKKDQYMDQRRAVHKKIINEYMANKEAVVPKGKKPTVIFLGGPPGSGKSEVILKKMRTDNFIILDNDEIKQKLPEYRGYNANLVHEEASDIYDEIEKKAAKRNMNVIFDATLKSTDKAKKRILGYQELGYDVRLYATNNPKGKTVRSATKRAIKKGRYVPIDYIIGNVEKINKSVRDLTPYVDKYKIYDVSNYPEPPQVMMEGTNTVYSNA